MTATLGEPSGAVLPAPVLLRLTPSTDGDTAALRQQLARCLASGISRIHVDVRDLDEPDLPALQALHGVADFLRRRGGALTVVGAGERVLDTIAHHRLEQLLPPASAGGAGLPTGSHRQVDHGDQEQTIDELRREKS